MGERNRVSEIQKYKLYVREIGTVSGGDSNTGANAVLLDTTCQTFARHEKHVLHDCFRYDHLRELREQMSARQYVRFG